jgi:hypothetical protein
MLERWGDRLHEVKVAWEVVQSWCKTRGKAGVPNGLVERDQREITLTYLGILCTHAAVTMSQATRKTSPVIVFEGLTELCFQLGMSGAEVIKAACLKSDTPQNNIFAQLQAGKRLDEL